MARRVSAAQFRSQLRQAQQKQKQAINRYNQKVRQHNNKVRAAVNNLNNEINRYNQKARAHNSRVRANRARLRSQLSQLNNRSTTTYVEYRKSVQTLHTAYTRFENRSETNQIGAEYNRFLDLAERETANSIEVANVLEGENANVQNNTDNLRDAELGNRLKQISIDLDQRWKGAVFSLNPQNPDAARHFCTSSREIFAEILDISAPDTEVFSALPSCEKTERGNATRKSKIQYLLLQREIRDNSFEEFIELNIKNVVGLFHVLSDGTHGSAGKFSDTKLSTIKKRVEDGINFLTEIILP